MHARVYAGMCVYMCVCACVRAGVHACMCVCVRACTQVHATGAHSFRGYGLTIVSVCHACQLRAVADD